MGRCFGRHHAQGIGRWGIRVKTTVITRDVLFLLVGFVIALIVITFVEGLSYWNFFWSNTEQLRNVAIIFAAVFGFPLLIWRSSAASKSANAAEQGNITDRYSKAVDQLGNENRSIRVGGIYALERIARDSPPDHWTIMEVLASFIRQELLVPSGATEIALLLSTQAVIKEVPARQADNYAALKVLGRRNSDHDDKNELLHLDMTNLDGALLQEMNLTRIDFFRAILRRSALQGANLTGANLGKADLRTARLQNAILINVNLKGTHLNGAKFYEAILTNADLRGVDLSKVQGLTEKQTASAQLDQDTQFPPGVSPKF